MTEDVHAPAAGAGPLSTPEDGLRRLYETHGRALLGFLIRITGGDRHKAEDIMQETLVRAWRHPDARDSNCDFARPWLFAVARRIAIDYARATMARPTEVGDDRIEDRPIDDVVDGLIDRAELLAALRVLPDRLRQVLVEVHLRQQSVAEAARTLGIPPGTVKSRTYHATRALRAELVKRGFLEPPRVPDAPDRHIN